MTENNLTKKAAEMLLKGATLLSEPCPYCSGVRVMREGHALCIGCGKEPEKRNIPEKEPSEPKVQLEKTLELKLQKLSKDLEQEEDHKKQQEILQSIRSIIETIEKAKK